MSRAAAPPSLRSCSHSAPSLMLLQQPDGTARRLPGGYGEDVPSDRVASLSSHSNLIPQLRERSPQYASDRTDRQRRGLPRAISPPGAYEVESQMRLSLPTGGGLDGAGGAGGVPSLGRGGVSIPSLGLGGVGALGGAGGLSEDAEPTEADQRRERWALERQQLREDMEAVERANSELVAKTAPSAPAPASPTREEVRNQLDEWRRYEATLVLQAAARGWAVRRNLAGRPYKLGAPKAHPMTRLVVPASRYFVLPKRPDNRSSKASVSSSASRNTKRSRPAAVRGAGAAARPTSASMAAQKHAREAVDQQLQTELERSRSRQVQSILSFDR